MNNKGTALWREWGAPELSPLAVKVQARLAKGLPVQDFITSNPYDHGFQFNPELLKEILRAAEARARRYTADPLGNIAAREAIAAYHGDNTSPDQVILTPGTSMAYFYLFRLLAREHGELLCPAPTYPLFDDLAKIAGLTVRRYHMDKALDADGTTRWAIDPKELEFQITPRTCAIVLVSPHNPTGSIINADEMEAIARVADAAGVPLIMDEVFRTYTRNENAAVPRPSEFGCHLTLTLNGLSKSHYLPGLKAGWIVVEGEAQPREAMMHALEYMSDSFLPVQEITQAAIADLLSPQAWAEAHRLAHLQRFALEKRIASSPSRCIAIPQAGPYICLPFEGKNTADEDRVVSQMLEQHGAFFHPGNLYAFPVPCIVATVYNQSSWPQFNS